MRRRSAISRAEVGELTELLRSEIHEFAPFEEYEAHLEKKRFLYRTNEVDGWVISALASALKEAARPATSEAVYSYLPGRGPLCAIGRASRKLRESAAPAFVVRRDVRSYTDSIPVHEESALWKDLARLVPDRALFENLKAALRPRLSAKDGRGERMNSRGIPTGLALTPWVANLYLKPIDDWALSLSSEDLYLRYGDDILYVSRDAAHARKFAGELGPRLARLGLEAKSEKACDWVITGNGSAPPNAGAFVPRSSFEYLGRKIFWSGHVGITGEKRSLLLREARYRVRNVLAAAKRIEGKVAFAEIEPDLGRAIFGALEDLWSRGWSGSTKFAPLRREINHPGEWRSLRIDLLREALKIATGSPSFHSLRGAGWKRILREWEWAPPGLSRHAP